MQDGEKYYSLLLVYRRYFCKLFAILFGLPLRKLAAGLVGRQLLWIKPVERQTIFCPQEILYSTEPVLRSTNVLYVFDKIPHVGQWD